MESKVQSKLLKVNIYLSSPWTVGKEKESAKNILSLK